jgi:hypothetical protein
MQSQVLENLSAVLGRPVIEVRKVRATYWVRFDAGCSFISNRIWLEAQMSEVKPFEFSVPGGRRGSKPWVAKIVGLDSKWGFAREFVEPIDIKWGRRGCDSAKYCVGESDLGYYQDSDDGYWEAIVKDGEVCCRMCSYQEVKHIMSAKSEAVDR